MGAGGDPFMFTIPIQTIDGRYDLFVIADDETMDRMKEHDPATIELLKLGHPWNTMKVRCVHLMYATQEEIDKLVLKSDTAVKLKATLKILRRGWKCRPEKGDSDAPYQSIDKNPQN